ncbi:DUF2164 domain-containing protein [Saccharospirillum salsuginis]|uniref:DUF2164 domain-containing protein n=1 Tax=Saccharospirillum salsuginis TaxID=418750 RepID=A0A918KDV7_9GAMM|nr:DUF2164 family protein [Saccharospirillum salsuginis]GGX59622.1 hypothetical protein GCM10007392_29470 [Saccharospirillum salsuginis]
MNDPTRPLMTKEARETLNQGVQRWFESELNLELGQFEADSVVDYFVEQLTPAIHNQAIQSALALLREYHARIEDDVYALEQPEP